MTLATLTDHERAMALLTIAEVHGMNARDGWTLADLIASVHRDREDAEKYRGLCR